MPGVHVCRNLQRVGIHREDGVQRGTVVIVGLDPSEVRRYELSARERSRGEGGVDPGYRGLFQDERRRRRGRAARADREGSQRR